jgi:hypothetical protein
MNNPVIPTNPAFTGLAFPSLSVGTRKTVHASSSAGIYVIRGVKPLISLYAVEKKRYTDHTMSEHSIEKASWGARYEVVLMNIVRMYLCFWIKGRMMRYPCVMGVWSFSRFHRFGPQNETQVFASMTALSSAAASSS